MTPTFDIQFQFDYLFKHFTASINWFSFHTAFGFAVVFSEVFLGYPMHLGEFARGAHYAL